MNYAGKVGLLTILVILVLGVVACAPASLVPSAPDTPAPEQPSALPTLEGSQWTLSNYRSADGGLIDVLPDTTITIAFADGQIKGNAGCNSYFGSYESAGGSLTFGMVAATEMWCEGPAGVMDQESAFLGLLGSVARHQIQGETLVMLDDAGNTLASWRLAPDEGSARAGLANPASVYCETQGGRLDIRTETEGEAGYCVFPDGSECEEWAYYRGECVPQNNTDLTPEMLNNAVYQSQFVPEGFVQLTDGEFRRPIMEGSATEIVVRLTEIAFADLNDDGVKDAAVILVSDPGGSGTFVELGVVLNQDGSPQHVASIMLGDRVQIRSLGIDQGQIAIEMRTQGEDDPMCCPSQFVFNRYALQGETLTEISSQVITPEPIDSEKAVPVALFNTPWQWQQLEEAEPATLSLVPDPENYTLLFYADGSLDIRADCNRARASYKVDGRVFRILPGPSTLAYCGESSFDSQFLSLLSQVDGFSLDDDGLQLHLANDAGKMMFAAGKAP